MTATGSAASGDFEKYTADVYGWAYRLLGRHHDALDVVQDVFLRWDAQCAQHPPDQPRPWLRRVTLNRAIDLTEARPAPAPGAARQTYHTVRSGDSLSTIAQKHYQSGSKWRAIYDANRSAIGWDPNRLTVGMRLVIPPG
ncbi:MAG: LysM peptidoglycan-binding domain-containing protein [Planctomycetes bacterium]|nr:LysM peptidoglycan-binding domain-containing protein [Planctomycetota bacterium]